MSDTVEILWETKAKPDNTIAAWRQEISDCYQVLKVLVDMDVNDAFRTLSQFSARASEMRSLIVLREGREQAAFRIKVLDPFLEECDRQFRVNSRIQAVKEMDAKLSGGRFA